MKKLLALILALAMTFSLCACGSNASSKSAVSEPREAEAPAADMAVNYVGGLGMVEESITSDASADLPSENTEKIIYSSDVTVETTDFDESLAALNALVERFGGWIQSSSVNGSDYYSTSHGYTPTRSASYTLRIPSERFNELMSSLSELGNVPYNYTYTENVTAQYYDVQARLTAYTAQETRLLEMMELAETVSDVIVIEEKLTELRYEIESLQSTLNNWDRRVNYSTVNVYLEEVHEYTPEAKMSYGEELLRSFVGGLKSVGRFFRNLLVDFIGALPSLVVIAVACIVLRPVWKKLRLRRKARKENKNAES